MIVKKRTCKGSNNFPENLMKKVKCESVEVLCSIVVSWLNYGVAKK